ncbi:hypothetical protein D3C72_2304270 [compost metagenome]
MFVAPAVQAVTVDALGFVIVEFVGDGFVFEPGTRLFHGVTGFDAVERVGHCVHWGYRLPQSLRFSMSVARLCGNETGSATGVQVLGFDGAWLGLP